MGMFDEIELETSIEAQEDKIGGGLARFDKTGHYVAVIEKAYAGVSNGGAFSVTMHLKREDGAKLTVTEYISSGTAKGCKNYYIDKNGNKQYLPGYNKIKNLDAILGFKRDYPSTSKGSVMLWDRDMEKEIPQERELIKDWIGKEIGLLGKVMWEDKYNDETNVREKFEIEHFLDSKTGKTRNEIVSGESGFKDKWVEAFGEDYVQDKRELSKNATVGEKPNTESTKEDDSPFP
jgi:hypothetical protein